MDLLLFQIGAAYRRDPVNTAFFLVLSAVAGIVIGYGVFGPALFG